MKLFMIRHGESTANAEKIHGQFNDELTEKGKEQAKAVTSIQCDKVYSSDVVRALETAKIIFPDREIIIDKRLRERDNGELGGNKSDFASLLEYLNHPTPGAESLEDCAVRARSFLKDLPEGTHCIVAHGIFLRVMIAVIKNLNIEEYVVNNRLKNCEVFEVEY
jgi:broad specificity phosphatase PhoE